MKKPEGWRHGQVIVFTDDYSVGRIFEPETAWKFYQMCLASGLPDHEAVHMTIPELQELRA